jgi:hypothetical protein
MMNIASSAGAEIDAPRHARDIRHCVVLAASVETIRAVIRYVLSWRNKYAPPDGWAWSVTTLVALCCLGLAASCKPAAAQKLDKPALQLLQELPFCHAGHFYAVPPELVAGVFLFENHINRSIKDSIQDAAFGLLLENTDEDWWVRWAESAAKRAHSARHAHLLSNKWPAEVVATGFVVSIGPAQITPRTAIAACAKSVPQRPVCGGGIKKLIASLLRDTESIELVSLVLSYERDEHWNFTGVDPSRDIGVWATLYNLGGDYFRARYRDQKEYEVSRLGRWVRDFRNIIAEGLRCGQD